MPQLPDSIPALVMRRLVNFAAPPPSPNVDLPPGAPVRSWQDAARDPVSALVEFLRGAVTGDLPTGPSAQGVGAMLNAAAPLAGAAGVMRKAASGATAEAAPALEAIAKRIKAYHGSPHDFDRFSLSKIGTGEGAQAYGHGLYFAEKEGVAKSYKDTLTSRVNSDPAYWADVKLPPSLTVGEQHEYNALASDMRKRGNLIGEDLERWRHLYAKKRSYDEAIEASKTPGRMYEVEIAADPDTLLDWDAPLSQQPKVLDRLRQSGQADGSDVFTPEGARSAADLTGEDLYRSYAGTRGAEVASRAARRAGIPGIKYLDGGSRGAGEGTRNYVIFDDSLVTILKKYGVALGVIEGLRRQAAANGGRLPAADVNAVVQQ